MVKSPSGLKSDKNSDIEFSGQTLFLVTGIIMELLLVFNIF